MSANFTEEGGTTAVSVEDATPLGVNVVVVEPVRCSSTFAGRADAFVLATVPVPVAVRAKAPVAISC